MRKNLGLVTALLVVVALAVPFASSTPALAADTGWHSPSANAADGTSAGDNDGFEVNPTNAYDDGIGGGTGSGFAASMDCDWPDGSGEDAHLYYDFGFSIPAGAIILGIEVRLDWYLDSNAGSNWMVVYLSWDGGSSWSDFRVDSSEPTSETTAYLGGASDLWGRSWSGGEFGNANFRVRIECDDGNNTNYNRDFYLDWVAVKVYYIGEQCTLTVISDDCCPIEVTYSLPTHAENFTVTAGANQTFTDIPCGTNVTLTVDDSDPCCVFDYWTGNVTGAPNSTNPITIIMDGDKTLEAYCHWLSYNLTVVSDGCCPVDVEYDDFSDTVAAGQSQDYESIRCCTNVTLTASNSSSCGFSYWAVDEREPTDESNVIMVHMDANHIATAVCNATAIGDTIFYDDNGNGTQDPGEGGVAGVDVKIYRDDGDASFEPEDQVGGGDDVLVDTETTDGDGKYLFPDLEAGCYWVFVEESDLPTGVSLTTNPMGPICLDPGEFYDKADFPALREVPEVGGEAYPISKFLILLPWIGFGAAIATGLAILARRRRAQS